MNEREREVVGFIHGLSIETIPSSVLAAARRHLLDLLGVAAAGRSTALADIVADHAVAELAPGSEGYGARLLFDGRRASAVGAALSGASTIDALDAHDGHRLTKGHVGCGVLPALLAAAELRGAENGATRGADRAAGRTGGTAGDGAQGRVDGAIAASPREAPASPLDEAGLLAALVVGYEIGTRAGIALHRTAADYHTSGAWVAIAAAAVVARVLGLPHAATREALGIAEYHGPRSPMMRVIDHPSMLKDGSGQGAMAGVSAALLARRGFTGAPAAVVAGEAEADLWEDLGERWRMTEQYVKLYPVCRWSQPAIAAALALRVGRAIAPEDIAGVSIGTFSEAARLDARSPRSTEEAQYSLPFPVAAALVHGAVGTAEITGEGLRDTRVLALARRIEVRRVDAYDALFPAERWSDVSIRLRDGRVLESGRVTAPGDPEVPLDEEALGAKFIALAEPALGTGRAMRLRRIVGKFGAGGSLATLAELIYPAPLAHAGHG